MRPDWFIWVVVIAAMAGLIYVFILFAFVVIDDAGWCSECGTSRAVVNSRCAACEALTWD